MDDVEFCKKIKAARVQMGLGQKELAELANVSYSTYRKIETGIIKNPGAENLLRISKALRMQKDSLFEPTRRAVENIHNILSQGFYSQTIALAKENSKIINDLVSSSVISTTNILNSYSEAFKNLSDSISRIVLNYSSILKVFDQHSGKLKEIIEAFINREKKNEEILKNSGWFLSPSFNNLNIIQIQEAISKLEQGESDAIFQLAKQFFEVDDYKELDVATKRWFKHPFFRRRKIILKEAIDNHKHHRYASSITLMLTQLEGIAGDYCDQNPSIKVKKKDSKGKIQKSFQNDSVKCQTIYFEAVWSVINTIIYESTESILKEGQGTNYFKGLLNRHGILHGSLIDFHTEENSYKCILLLDILSLITKE